MSDTDLLNLALDLGDRISEEIRECYPRSWKEDIITYKIVEQVFGSLANIVISEGRGTFQTVWDAYKLSGNCETRFGDIAIFIKLVRPNTLPLEGIAFLEAKRIYEPEMTFKAVKLDQLRRIHNNSPAAQLLLYDHRGYTATNDIISLRCPTTTNAICIPLNIALGVGAVDTNLYQFGSPLSVQLVTRYLLGYDLDMRQETLEFVKNAEPDEGAPRYLIIIGVAADELTPILPDLTSSKYERIIIDTDKPDDSLSGKGPGDL